ncbi:hypothetical protein L484_016226 [Morus notabilis]|uniref:Uncharacterized protein n=1 Tax=Morus notabilis TaxID=981085 RepID=W9QSR4_9ROSA|nr:hypothetical protein L484_016226 [Morus notabilis]
MEGRNKGVFILLMVMVQSMIVFNVVSCSQSSSPSLVYGRLLTNNQNLPGDPRRTEKILEFFENAKKECKDKIEERERLLGHKIKGIDVYAYYCLLWEGYKCRDKYFKFDSPNH